VGPYVATDIGFGDLLMLGFCKIRNATYDIGCNNKRVPMEQNFVTLLVECRFVQ
jgi:hypothetical protein